MNNISQICSLAINAEKLKNIYYKYEIVKPENL